MRRLPNLPLWLEIPATLVARALYRVRVLGAAEVPARGGAVLVANHLSYVDVVVLQLACPRPLRFLASLGPETGGFLRWLYRLTGAIPVSDHRSTGWFRAAVAALKQGEIVCLFPEGGISRTGQLMELRRGFEVLARHGGVPIVPAAIDGLWGSVFSFAGNKYLWKSPRLTPTPVCVAFGPPISPQRAGAGAVRQALMELGTEAFGERPVLRRHVGREIVRGLARRPGGVAIIDRTAGRRVVRAATLVAASAVLARRLRQTVPERRVGIVLPPGAGAAIANLAVICAGKIPVNLNFTAGRTAVESSLAAAGVRTVLSADALRPRLPDFPWPEGTRDLRAEIQAGGGTRALIPWLAALWLLPNQWVAGLLGLPRVGDRSEAVLLFTSGSAGDPKGVVLSHRNLLANFAQISSMSILPSSATMLGCLPIFHSFGFTVTLGYPLLRGCRLVTIPSPLDTRAVIDAIRDEKVTVLIGAPTFLRPLMKKALPSDLRSLDLAVSGAEKLPEDLRAGFLERFHVEILQGYGLTETSPVSNVNQPHPPMTTPTADPQKGKKAGTVGRLLPGMAARSVHPESGETLPVNETGVLWLRGANVFSHYLDDEAATASAIRDGWFVTRDLGRIDEEGFVTVEGRLARFSKIGGEMVPHGTIEHRLGRLLGLDPGEAQSVVVVGVPDDAKGERLVVLSSNDLTAAQVRDGLAAAGFPNLWIPRTVLRVAAIPFLGTGKLDLAACRRLAFGAKGWTTDRAQRRVIDAHIHVYPAEVAADPIAWAQAQGEPGWVATVAPSGRRSIQGWADPEAAIADMDEAGIDAGVMLGWYWERQETCDLQNRWHAEWIRRHPGRLAAFAAVQPAAGQRAVDALERALDDGLCGVGELLPQAQGFGLEDPAWRRIVETAIRRRVPINLHATDPQAGPAAGPKTPLGAYVRLARDYPEATFILAHWGGGLAARAMEDLGGDLPSNLYFDTAASPLLYDIGIFRRAVDRTGASRILYGSDYPLMLYPRQSRQRGFRRFLEEIEGAGLDAAEREAILSGNLRRILPAGLAPAGKAV